MKMSWGDTLSSGSDPKVCDTLGQNELFGIWEHYDKLCPKNNIFSLISIKDYTLELCSRGN